MELTSGVPRWERTKRAIREQLGEDLGDRFRGLAYSNGMRATPQRGMVFICGHGNVTAACQGQKIFFLIEGDDGRLYALDHLPCGGCGTSESFASQLVSAIAPKTPEWARPTIRNQACP